MSTGQLVAECAGVCVGYGRRLAADVLATCADWQGTKGAVQDATNHGCIVSFSTMPSLSIVTVIDKLTNVTA